MDKINKYRIAVEYYGTDYLTIEAETPEEAEELVLGRTSADHVEDWYCQIYDPADLI